MKVKDLLRTKDRDVITIQPGANLMDAMGLLIKHKISCLPVTDDAEGVIGIISDRDIFREAFHNSDGFGETTVGDLMTKDVIIGVPDDKLTYIAGIMTNNRIRHIPIVEDGKLLGLVSTGDVVKTQIDGLETENRYLKQYIMKG